MRFQKTNHRIQGRWRYEAQFQNPHTMGRAQQWLAPRVSGAYEARRSSILTDDLQVIFMLRLFQEPWITVIRAHLD
jgi:hypothetical protein